MLTIDVLPPFFSRSHRDRGATSESHHSMTGLLFQKAYNLQCLLQVRAFSRYIRLEWLVIQNAKRYTSRFGSCSALGLCEQEVARKVIKYCAGESSLTKSKLTTLIEKPTRLYPFRCPC